MITNQSLGVRIKYFRKKKGITQKDLGDAVGVNDSTIRNYELGNRTPDANTLAKIAGALEVDFYTLSSADVNSLRSAAHALFDIEDLYGLVPEQIDGRYCLVVDQKDRFEYSERSEEKRDGFNAILMSWYKARMSLLENKVTEDLYISWKEKYPEFSDIDENGIPYIPTERRVKEASLEEEMQQKYKLYISAKEWAGEKDIMSYDEFISKAKSQF